MIRINAGGGEINTSMGVFSADNGFSPVPGNTFARVREIAGTTDDALYHTERHGTNGAFNYILSVPNGIYNVVLHFAEIYHNEKGKRVFDIRIQNVLVKDNYDVLAKAGGQFVAIKEMFTTVVTNGILTINFSSAPATGGVDTPKVSAIEVLPLATAPTTTTSTTSTTTTSTTTKAPTGTKLPVNEGFITLKVDETIKGESTDASPLSVDWSKVVFMSENGKKWRLSVDNNGIVKTTPIQ